MLYRPDDCGQWCIQCTRGASSQLWDVWVYAPSRTRAIEIVRSAGYQPATPHR